MNMPKWSLAGGVRLGLVALFGAGLALQAGPVLADHPPGGGQSFTFLQAGFTQDVYGVGPDFMGGVAFAPDGDPLVNGCAFIGSPLQRFDRQAAPIVVNATPLQPRTQIASNAGCGMTNHPNGSIYTNTSSGVVRLNADTGAQIGSPFGASGNALGITPDPITGNLVYVGSGNDIRFVDADFTATGVFSTVTSGGFVDGIYFDPSGQFLFMSQRSPSFSLTIVKRDGSLVRTVPMSSEPDGIAFHASAPRFVVTANTNATMTRFDFPGDDFTALPVQSVFASGGFRSDLSNVGPDGCLYLTQDGTRFDNGITSLENSLVRICGGFAPPIGTSQISLGPLAATNPVGTKHTVSATVLKDAKPAVGVLVSFTVSSGPNAGATGTCLPADCKTDAAGKVTWSYTGLAAGTDTIQASFQDETGATQLSNPVTKTWEKSKNPCQDLNGGFERGPVESPECWTLSSVNNGIARIEVEGACFGANNTKGITLFDRRSLNVRSSPQAPVDSVGIATSDPFTIGSRLTFKALVENDDAIPSPDPVLLTWRLLDVAGTTELASGVVTPSILTTSPGTSNDGCLVGDVRDGTFSTHGIDTLTLAGTEGRLEFRQHTKVAGKGFFALIDEVAVTNPA